MRYCLFARELRGHTVHCIKKSPYLSRGGAAPRGCLYLGAVLDALAACEHVARRWLAAEHDHRGDDSLDPIGLIGEDAPIDEVAWVLDPEPAAVVVDDPALVVEGFSKGVNRPSRRVPAGKRHSEQFLVTHVGAPLFGTAAGTVMPDVLGCSEAQQSVACIAAL